MLCTKCNPISNLNRSIQKFFNGCFRCLIHRSSPNLAGDDTLKHNISPEYIEQQQINAVGEFQPPQKRDEQDLNLKNEKQIIFKDLKLQPWT